MAQYTFRVFWLKCPHCLRYQVFLEIADTGSAECLGCGKFIVLG